MTAANRDVLSLPITLNYELRYIGKVPLRSGPHCNAFSLLLRAAHHARQSDLTRSSRLHCWTQWVPWRVARCVLQGAKRVVVSCRSHVLLANAHLHHISSSHHIGTNTVHHFVLAGSSDTNWLCLRTVSLGHPVDGRRQIMANWCRRRCHKGTRSTVQLDQTILCSLNYARTGFVRTFCSH